MVRKLLFGALVFALGFSTVALGSASSGPGGNPHDKVWVCHSTASETNPWILIHIKTDGWANGHEGVDAHPGHRGRVDHTIPGEKGDYKQGPADAEVCEDGHEVPQ